MDLLYLLIMPVELLYNGMMEPVSTTNYSVSSSSPYGIKITKDIFSMFNLIGCPLLLACMCIERYGAVVRPVLYLRLSRREYRMAVSGTAWTLTMSFCLAIGLMQDMVRMMVPVSIIISCLFLIMLASLWGVVRSLWLKSSAQNQAHGVSSSKRRAASNVLAVMVLSVMSFLPVLVMFPVVLYEYYRHSAINNVMCTLFELSRLFPKSGLIIGPLFYLSKARRINVLCRK
ncbi:uncharacterized protein LOC106946321 [Poecilia latipinna]|uniref:uncharacterized protein LOC106946321 n=1 Tax=Poecilia latipinna TaxID=48699 RepID=UPI00072E2072|nr:PREDICTED: uncharacterized protein LOC106946321 [Poecilia latipinna]XP_016537007.1 PREDICTED: uncharacterized protein LOC103151514 [Poecilia formosa]